MARLIERIGDIVARHAALVEADEHQAAMAITYDIQKARLRLLEDPVTGELYEAYQVGYAAFKLNPLSWTTKDKREMHVREMTDDHLWATIAMIDDGRMKKQGRTRHKDKGIDWWRTIFLIELYLRQKQRGA
jgi:hypothetical protein